jgi:hypothetical protein
MAEQIFMEGIRCFPKRENQPDFVIGSMVITIADVLTFFNTRKDLVSQYNGKDQMKLQLLKSKGGGFYLAVDTYKPSGNTVDTNQDSDLLPF